MHKKVLITGGTGYIGNYIAKIMAATHPDVQIFALSRQKLSSSPDPITAKFKNIEFVKGDCLHP
jgi:nucleoside-diphosphate-sugar epimerase